MTNPERLVVIGQGYVGLPLSMRAVDAGYDVLGFEVDDAKVAGLNSGHTHIDDVTDADVSSALSSGRYRASSSQSDVIGFDIAVITVPTPLKFGAPDLSFIEGALDVLAPGISAGSTVILESTTWPGTTDEIVVPTLEAATGLQAGVDFHVGYSPERIDPGNPTWTFTTTPKVVAGINPESLKLVQNFYDRLVDTTVPVSTAGAAELTKLLENTFRHVNVALVNELAVHAHALGIDIWEVIEAAGSKPFGFMQFWPGPGVGGHCLPIDPSYLSWRVEQQLGSTSRFVEIANDVNKEMPKYVVQRVQSALNAQRKSVNGSRILVVGLSYKANSNDARETPAAPVIEGLLTLGAEVAVHDHLAGPHRLDDVAPRVELDAGMLSNTDAVVIVTNHSDLDRDLLTSSASLILDTRHCVSGHNVEQL